MAKIYGLFGSMNGKLADTVMAVRNGVQIVRKYQPSVSNPKSAAQVGARAKLKLISQLSAVLAPYLAIKREGNVTSRNLFTKVNYPIASYANDEASIDLNAVQLTRSAVGLPSVQAVRAEGAASTLNVSIGYPVNDVDRIVYVGLIKDTDNRLRVAASTVVSEAGTGNDYAGTLMMGSPREAVVLAYGVRDNTETARVVFGNMEVIAAEQVAKLIASRILTENDITLTETRGVTIAQQA